MRQSAFVNIGRTAMILGGLSLVAIAAWGLATLAGVAAPAFPSLPAASDLGEGILGGSAGTAAVAALLGASVLLLGVAAAVFGLRGTPRMVVLPGGDTADDPPGGEVAVSSESLNALVRRATAGIDGARAETSDVRLRRKRLVWNVEVGITVARDVSLQHVVAELRPRLDEALAFHTGLGLGGLRVRAELEPRGHREIVRVH